MVDGRDTPIIDLIAERDVVIPRGPLRERLASKELIAEMTARVSSELVLTLVKDILKGDL